MSFVNDIDGSFKDELLTKKGELRQQWEGKILLKKHAYLNTEYLGMLVDDTNPLTSHSPTKIKAIREAMNYAINRPQLMMYLRNSIGIAAEAGFVPGGLPSHNAEMVKGYSFDPAKAKKLLAEAGFPEGKNLPPIKLLTIAVYADVGSFVARQLVKLGGDPEYREGFLTDNGNIILDVYHFEIMTPIALEESIQLIPGVVECGLFAKRCANDVLIASADGVKKQ